MTVDVLQRALAALVIGGLAIASCSSPDNTCPTNLPNTGDACLVPPNTSSTPGAVPECNYVTDSNECGAAFCVCSKGAWSCGATCVIDAGGFDQYVAGDLQRRRIPGRRFPKVRTPRTEHEEAAAEDSGKDAAAVEASMNDGTLTEYIQRPIERLPDRPAMPGTPSWHKRRKNTRFSAVAARPIACSGLGDAPPPRSRALLSPRSASRGAPPRLDLLRRLHRGRRSRAAPRTTAASARARAGPCTTGAPAIP